MMIRLAVSLFALAWAFPCTAADNVRIALSFPFSGAFGTYGELYMKEYQLFAEDLNAHGGVLGGRQLELVPMDNKNSPQEALLNLKLATDQRIPFIVQGAGSHIALALAEGVARHNAREPANRLLYLNQSGDYDLANSRCSFWTFLFDAHSEMRMEALVSSLAARSDIKRVFIINQDYAHGQNVSREAKEMLARKRPDIIIVGDVLHPLGKVKDFAPYAAKIKASGADAVITANWGNDLALLIKAAGEAGLRAEFYTFYGNGPGAPTAMGDAAIGKVKVVYRWHPNIAGAQGETDNVHYRKRYGTDYYGLPVRNLLEMLVKAIDLAGSTEALDVARALEGMRHDSVTGEVWMRAEDHQLMQPLYLFTLTRTDGHQVRYDFENTGIGTRTDARIEAQATVLPTICRMQRP
jgi:branched-chain amino acid transport system substrate-binding protein